jgi:outer membrane protein OmpA-like peptidoglycan-associated protein
MLKRIARSLATVLAITTLPATIMVASAPSATAAPTTSTSGTSFVAAITPNLGVATPYLYLSGRTSGQATIYYPDGTDTTVALSSGSVQTILVPTSQQMATSDTGEVNRAIRVTSTVPISLYGCTYNIYTSDCTNYTPVPVWGTRYRPVSNPTSGDRITLMTAANAATVSITFKNAMTADGTSYTAGQTISVNIAPYKVYTLKASSGGENFSGALITSNVPVGLIAGNDCTNVIAGACDAIMEMVPAESSLGRNFFVNNYASNNKGTLVRIVAAETGTTLQISGDESLTVNLAEGQVYNRVFFSTGGNRAVKIASNKPILVAKLMPGSGQYDSGSGPTTGDPALSYMPPYEQYLSDYTFVNAPNFIAQFINVTIPTSALGTLRLDGVLADTSRFISLPSNPEWKIGVVYTTTGTHRMTASLPFGLEVYGANDYNSYAYVGGASYVPLASITSLTSNIDTSTGETGGFACFSTTVTDTNTAPIAGARVDATIVGANSSLTPFGITDENGIAQICYRGLIQGTDTVTVTVNGLTTDVVVTWVFPTNPPTWVTTTLDTLTVGTYSGITLDAGAWETLTITAGSLPAGMSFDPVTGEITGTPTTAGPYSVEFTSTNAAGSSVRVFSGVVVVDPGVIITPPSSPPAPAAPKPEPVISSPSFITVPTFTLTQGVASNSSVAASGANTYEVSGSGLPAGLTLNSTTGVISGTPTNPGTYSVTIIAGNAGGRTSATFTFVVKPAESAPNPNPQPTDNKAPGVSTPSAPVISLDPIVPNAQAATTKKVVTTIDGVTESVVVVPTAAANGLEVKAQDWKLTLAAHNPDGQPAPLNSESQIIFKENQTAHVMGVGFKPNSEAKVYIFSDAILLGTLKVDAGGNFVGNLPVPADLAAGPHILQVNGVSPKDQVRSASISVLYQKSAPVAQPVVAKKNTLVIPFAFNKYAVGKTQQEIIKMIAANPGSKIRVTGYAQKSKPQPDIAISLDRALEVKMSLVTFVPDAQISVLGQGAKQNKLCKKYKNKCVVVTVAQG